MSADAALGNASFRSVVRAEIIFNATRALPYALMLLFAGNALLWWGKGAASSYGWATNSDYYILRHFTGFTFLTLPLFTALMMADPVNRDFDLGIDPLIFSKPIRRVQYLAGKFLGNFFVLMCCEAVFVLTLIVLQAFRPDGMLVLPPRVLPYIQQFVVITMVGQLGIAAFCFAVGTITRNTRSALGGVIAMYFVYIGWQLVIRGWSPRARLLLDPLMMNFRTDLRPARGAELLNSVSIAFTTDVLINRLMVIALAGAALAVVHHVFARRDPVAPTARAPFGRLDLASGAGQVAARRAIASSDLRRAADPVSLPFASVALDGVRARAAQFTAAVVAELRLLRAERGIVIIVPLAFLLTAISMAAFIVPPDLTYSGAYSRRAAEALWPFIVGITVFYTGAMMHRERELRIEPLVWSAPISNAGIVLSKYVALLITLHALMLTALLAAAGVQAFTHHGVLSPGAAVRVYLLVLLPGTLFLCGVSFALHAVVRDRLVVYALSIAGCGGLLYLYSQGHNGWLYNPVLYRLWSYERLFSASSIIAMHALYTAALGIAALSLALLAFNRSELPRNALRRRGAVAGILAGVAMAVIAGTWIARHT